MWSSRQVFLRRFASAAGESNSQSFDVLSFLNRVEAMNKSSPKQISRQSRPKQAEQAQRSHSKKNFQPKARTENSQNRPKNQVDRRETAPSSKWRQKVNQVKSSIPQHSTTKMTRFSDTEDLSSLMSSAAVEERLDLHLPKKQTVRSPFSQRAQTHHRSAQRSPRQKNRRVATSKSDSKPVAQKSLSADLALASLFASNGPVTVATYSPPFDFAPQCQNLYSGRVLDAAKQVETAHVQALAAIEQCIRGRRFDLTPSDRECVNSVALANSLNSNPSISLETKKMIASLVAGDVPLASLKSTGS